MVSRILVWTQAISLLAWAVLHAYFNAAINIDYYAFDGTFQSYNAAARMRNGEFPYRDFGCYLGIGPTYVDRAASLTGPTYADWDRGRMALRLGLLCLTIGLLARLVGMPMPVVLALPPILFCLDVYFRKFPEVLHRTLGPLRNFNIDDYSSLTVRAFAPCIFGLGVYAAAAFRRSDDGGSRAPLWRGFLTGLCLAWSNDYGIPTLIAVALGYVLFAPLRSQKFTKVLLEVVLICAVALATAALVIWLACGFNLSGWYSYNFEHVAPNQKWFYFARVHYFSQVQSLRLADLPLAACVLPIVLFVWVRLLFPSLTARRRLGFEAATIIVVAAFGAGMMTTIGGYRTIRYFIPFVIYGSILLLGLICATWQRARLRTLSHAGSLPGKFATAIGVVGLFLTWGAVAAQARLSWKANDECSIYSDELGGRLTSKFDRTEALGLELRRRCDAENLPPKRRLSSTYTSGLDVIAGAQQPSEFDYLLHAVSPELLSRYVRDFRAAEPRYVTSLRHDMEDPDNANWEGWQRNVSWPFFAELVRNYEPFSRTHAHVVWQRREAPREAPAGTVRWELQERSHDRVRYALTLDAVAAEPMLVEVTARHKLTWAHTPWKHGCFAKLAVVITPDGHGDLSCFALSPNAESTAFSVLLEPNVAAILEFVALPAEDATIEIEVTAAAPVAPARLLTGKPIGLLCPSPCTDEQFASGIARDGRTAFRVTEAGDIADLRPGEQLMFAAAGRRIVQEVAGDTVVVDGAPLNPDDDGYPHLIERTK